MQRIVEPTLSFLASKTPKKLVGFWAATTLVACLIAGCHDQRPNIDLVLAREAVNAASEVEAQRYSPALYHRAEESFRKANTLYQEQQYEDAIREFRVARSLAEKAENASRVQRQKAGEEGL